MTYQPLIYTGNQGMVGAAIIKNLQTQGFTKLTTQTHAELELTNQRAVRHKKT
jgi:GDP-L-fucose synthase